MNESSFDTDKYDYRLDRVLLDRMPQTRILGQEELEAMLAESRFDQDVIARTCERNEELLTNLREMVRELNDRIRRCSDAQHRFEVSRRRYV